MSTHLKKKYLSSDDIRQLFLDYFSKQQHEVVPSASLIPFNDATLLFTNAGMVPFKDVFLGKEKRPYQRATSSQRCVRAGGKHNDLDQVGYTARHHTFFEMLGNFSFGDYFKREAIGYAWDFLTSVLKLPPEKLWVTVFENDREAEDIWLKEIKVDPTRFSRCGEKDNFWSMGETGPCGPCTEIFYDHGPAILGGPPGSDDADGDRYIEIWNLVFMQYDRLASGELVPLPKPSVDTGMGLERLSAVLQGVHNNYETDLFEPLLASLALIADIPTSTWQNPISSEAISIITSMRVIVDHIRSSSFLIADGVVPSNEGRGYVLRRIIRRAIRHGHKLGIRDIFFYRLVEALVKKMGHAYPALQNSQSYIEHLLKQEETQFLKTLEQGLKILEQDLLHLPEKMIPGDIIFKLYDTFGFPPDLTGDIARERGFTLDLTGFSEAMEKQRARSQASSQFVADYHAIPTVTEKTEFLGYDKSKLKYPAAVQALIVEGKLVDSLEAGQSGIVILTASPFYPEGGGQVGDQGQLMGEHALFVVSDTQKQAAAIAHIGEVRKGSLQKGDIVEAEVDYALRHATALNHSATHLLHAALRQILGSHVEQKGSLVAPDRLRFDFSHTSALTADEIDAVEFLVNEKIRDNLLVETKTMAAEKAIAEGAMALFGEKYEEDVRVLSMGSFSKELCGGTHVERTGDIGLFKIISESGVAAGIRRLEALTGIAAYQYMNVQDKQLRALAHALKTVPEYLSEKFSQLLRQVKQQEKKIIQLQQQVASGRGSDISLQAEKISGVNILVHRVDKVDIKVLRQLVDQYKAKLNPAIILLGSVTDDKVTVLVGVTKPLCEHLSADAVVQHIAPHLGGKGGGRQDMAQLGSQRPEKLDEVLEGAKLWIKEVILHRVKN